MTRVSKFGITALLFALTSAGQSAGQPRPGWIPANPRYVFQPIAERFDISTITVTALAQDRTGLLWMGTQEGLLRYDGSRITRFGRESGLPTLFIDQLAVSADGTLWVGTNDGIARFQRGKFERVPIPVPGARIDSLYQILAVDNADGLYIATSLGLLRLDQRDPSKYKLWTSKDGLPADAVDAVFFAADGALYFTSGNRVGRLRSVNAAPEILPAKITTSASIKSLAILVDHDSVIWVRTPDHVLRLNSVVSEFQTDDDGIPQANDFGIPVLDRSGQLMVPTVRGLFHRSNGRWEQIGERQGMETNAVFAAMEDREGAIWIGYGGSGVARWAGSKSWSAWTKPEGLPDNVVWCEMRDQRGRLWVGTDNGLGMWDPATQHWRPFTEKDGLAGATVRQLALGRDGAIWTVSVPGGVSRIDPNTLRITPTPAPAGVGDAAGIAVAPDGRIWAGNSRSLKTLSLASGVPVYENVDVPQEAAGTTSHPIFAPNGTLWSSGRNGISRFDGHTWTVYTTNQGLRTNVVPTVIPISADEAWFRYVEPLGLGHLEIKDTVKVTHLTEKEGLASNGIFLLGVDASGRVWAGGNQGLNVVDAGRIHSFNRTDGLIWNDLSAGSFWPDADGSVYIGTSRGLARYLPQPGDFDARRAGVLITSAKLGGEERLDEPNPQTQHSSRTFTALFTELTLRDAEKTLYRYRVDGLESDYTETTLREARYVSLPSGSFRFEVSCKLPNGTWTEPAFYQFTVLPVWWERWWVRVAGFVLFALLIAAAIRLRTRSLEADRRRLEEAVEARSAELAQANRELAEAAVTDPLTKARNRRFFDIAIPIDIERAIRSCYGVTRDREDLLFYMVDIDHFKQVNDALGHQAGDHVLRKVAERLERAIRGSDTLVRWGGEEFLIIARNTRREDALELAQRVLNSIGCEPFDAGADHNLTCTCSIGWVAFPWSLSRPHGRGVQEMIQLVDRALYIAKESGRNQCIGLAPFGSHHSDEHIQIGHEQVAVIRTPGPGSETTRNSPVLSTPIS